MQNSNKKVINMEPDIKAIKINPPDIFTVMGIGQNLPFKDNAFSGVHIKAVLHHVPDDLGISLAEIERVLENNGVVIIQEPLCNNPIDRLARKLFTTNCTDPGEKPFDPVLLDETVSNYFNIGSIRYYFLLSHLMPHIACRLPLKHISRLLIRLTVKFDQFILAHFPYIRYFSSHMEILAIKR
jgi:SAM-dependent methyltransferase